MKRGLTVVLAVLMIMSLFVACKNTEGAPTVSVEKAAESATELSSLKTFGDLLALEGAEMQGSSSGEKFFVYVFRYNDVYWRALAEMSEETREAFSISTSSTRIVNRRRMRSLRRLRSTDWTI